MIYLRRKTAGILFFFLGGICLVDGIFSKKDLKEILVGGGVFIYGIKLFVGEIRKKQRQPGQQNVAPGQVNLK